MRLLLFVLLLCLTPLSMAAPRVVASIEPLAMVLREVLGEQVQVSTLMLPGQTPHFAAMTPGQARQLQQAELLVWLGPEAEPAVAKLAARLGTPSLALVGLPGVTTRDAGDHRHDGHDHSGLTLDPHLWLSPDNILALSAALPGKARHLGLDQATVNADSGDFQARLQSASAAGRESLAPLKGVPWLSHHHPFAYFGDYFGLSDPLQISDSIAGEASARRFARLADAMATQSVRCAIAEPEARRDLLMRLCQEDCRVVLVDPLGRDQSGAGYTAFFSSVVSRFRQCLAGD